MKIVVMVGLEPTPYGSNQLSYITNLQGIGLSPILRSATLFYYLNYPCFLCDLWAC